MLFHDLRRTAARNLLLAGEAEGIIVRIGGWRTSSVCMRYAIVVQSDIKDAMSSLEAKAAVMPVAEPEVNGKDAVAN